MLEVIISRMGYMGNSATKLDELSSKKNSIQIVGLGISIANAREVGECMGVSEKSLFNFSLKV